jgi:hypothetical protein
LKKDFFVAIQILSFKPHNTLIRRCHAATSPTAVFCISSTLSVSGATSYGTLRMTMKTYFCQLFEAEAHVNNICEFSPYRKENTTLHHYKDQLINAV